MIVQLHRLIVYGTTAQPPARKLSQRAHCPQSAPASPHRGHCTAVKLKKGVIVKLQTSRIFVSSSTRDTALKHKTGTGIGTKLRKAPSEISHHVIWVPCGGGLDREIVSRRLISSDEFTFHTSILAPQTGTPSHLLTFTRRHGEQDNYVFIVPWCGIITVGQRH